MDYAKRLGQVLYVIGCVCAGLLSLLAFFILFGTAPGWVWLPLIFVPVSLGIGWACRYILAGY